MEQNNKTRRLDSSTVKKLYIEFFKTKAHTVIDNAPLIPQNDPSALFTTAGMHPLVPYLMGEPHPSGTKRLVNIQKCMRTTDVDQVGRSRRHLTLFEMAGNWSLNDYFKKESLPWSLEFLTDEKWLGLDPKRLYATVFAGTKELPLDEESIATWKQLFTDKGIEASVDEHPGTTPKLARISYYEDNWWGPVSATGPCGPDSEIFYDTGLEHNPAFGEYCHPNCDCGRFVEVWNNVFMEFVKKEDGSLQPAPLKNVDTGLGVIRTTFVTDLRNEDGTIDRELTIFSTDVFEEQAAILYPFIFGETLTQKLDTALLEKNVPEKFKVAFKVALEHTQATSFIGAEGLEPSNKDQGYVLRRLLRRAIRSVMVLIDEYTPKKQEQLTDILVSMAEAVMNKYSEQYPHLLEHKNQIISNIQTEAKKFQKALRAGMAILEKTPKESWDGEFAFNLYQSYGFPIELTQEIAEEKGVTISKEDYEAAIHAHQTVSKQGMDKHFAGGLGDDSEMTVRYHTATHLLHKALRDILGPDIHQQGSNNTQERLRFDINLNRKLEEKEVVEIENKVNAWIKAALPVVRTEMSPAEADAMGALAFFKEKYGNIVSVYSIKDGSTLISAERCGGPHVKNTSELGTFKISKQEKIGSNALRIKAQLT